MEMELLRHLESVESLSYGDHCVMASEGVSSQFIYPPFPSYFESVSNSTAMGPKRLLFAGSITKQTTGGGLREALEVLLPPGDLNPTALIEVVGPGRDSELTPWQGNQFVHFSGWVNDINPYWQRADVLLASLRVERGIRIKLIEAMARGVPIIATPEALYGFGPEARDAVMVYRNATELRDLVSKITIHPKLLAEYRQRGREFYLRNFSLSGSTSRILAFHQIG